MSNTAKLAAFRERHEKKKAGSAEKVSEGGALLKNMARDGAIGSKILAHNGFIAILYVLAMALVAYASLQAAFYFVAILAGSTGAYLMATEADVLTVYVIIAVVCGFDLFFSFKIESALIRAMSGRFWHKDAGRPDGIDRGAVYHKKHGES